MNFFKKKEKNADGTTTTRDRVISIALSPSALVLSTYLLLLITKLIDLTLINRENEYFSVVILQMMIFLLPGAIWCRMSGEKFTQGLRIRLPRISSIPLILSGAFLLASGITLIGLALGGLDSMSGSFSLYDTFISKDTGELSSKIYLIMAYAALPAICEEFVFRGILCREYEIGGVLRAILFSSLFFACLHFDLRNFIVYFFAGVILALSFYATRSLIGSMIVHFLYNLFGLFGQPYMNTLYSITGSSALFIFVLGIIFLLSAAIFCASAAKLYRSYLYSGVSADYRKAGKTSEDGANVKNSYLTVIKDPFTIACFAVYIVALIISWL